jgi:mono/diheme cytochrome c family protein
METSFPDDQVATEDGRNVRVTRRARLIWIAALALVPVFAFAQGMQIPKPTPGLFPNSAAGEKLFATDCVQCHGADLRGSKQGPPLVHRIYEPSHHSDAAFQIAVKYGTRQHHWNFGDMPPRPDLSPDDVAHITAYVRAAQRKAGIR